MLGMCLPYVKSYFQPHQENLLFKGQITQILLFLLMRLWKRYLWERFFSATEVLGKGIFSGTRNMLFFFRGKIIQICLFSVMPVWERSKAAV